MNYNYLNPSQMVKLLISIYTLIIKSDMEGCTCFSDKPVVEIQIIILCPPANIQQLP